MSNGDVDISWQTLRRIVQEWAGVSVDLTHSTPLHGGNVSTTLALGLTDGRRVVIKVSPHRVDRSHEREAYQLNQLRQAGIPVPEVYAWKVGSLDDPFSYVLMEYVDGMNLAKAKKACSAEQFDRLQKELAEHVRNMHNQTAPSYMRVLQDSPATFKDWGIFYQQLNEPIWQEARSSAVLPIKARKQISKVHDRLDRLLAHTDCPRLVHGDLSRRRDAASEIRPGGSEPSFRPCT